MIRKIKDFYGAHPIRRVLVTLVIVLLTAALIYFRPAFSLKAAAVPAAPIPHAAKGAEIPVGEKVTVAKEGGRTLSLDTKELIFTLTDDATGKTWISALPGSREDKDKALLQITFLGNDNAVTQWNTYENCVSFGTFKLFEIENGVRIEMDVNEGESSEFFEYLPQRIPTLRYEEFLMPTLQACLEDGTIEESEFKKYERALKMVYKKNNAENCYVLTTSGTPSISASNQLIAMTKIVGYDRDMLIEDCAAFGAVPDFHEPAQFDIVLEAFLENGDFMARLSGDEMKTGNDFYQLYRVAVLPSLGSENYDKERDGYFLIPDGAGALMRFNTYTATVPEYVRPFLDNDYYSDYFYMPDYSQDLLTPVFGILNGGENPEKGLMAIIEGGVETANLHCTLASPSGSGTNRLYASFDVMDYSRVKIYGAYADNGATYLSSSGHISADYCLRYRPYGKGVTYFDLAMDYREHLAKTSGKEISRPEGPRTYLEFIGGVTLADRILGVPYDKTASMTTTEDLMNILRELPDGSVAVQYDGAYNGGILSGLNDGARWVRENGSAPGDRVVTDALSGKTDLPLFWQVNLSRVYNNGRSYVPYFHALRDFSNQAAEIYSYSPATTKLNGRWDPIRSYTRVSPRYLPYLAEKLKADAAPGTGFAIGDLAHDFFLDYRYQAVIDPVQARILVKDALLKLEGPLSLHDPAADLAPLGQWAVDVSRDSSDYASFYATIPFKQLALSGLTQIAGEDVNLSSHSLNDALLTAAELGTSVKYTVTARNPYAFKSSHFEYLYAVNWADWQSEINDAIAQTTFLREEIGGKAIVNHRMLSPQVFETTYEGGIKVLVNYGGNVFETEDRSVPAHSFIIQEGGDTL
ncbi:MAG: hypothetical protein IKP72_12990 [Clostridia bacterium]|nr:hypothetical protein [Clostridia bacterium]